MSDASARPNTSAAATPQPEAQITTGDVIERFTLDIGDVPREALQQWVKQASQCPSWCTKEHPEPELESTKADGFHHDSEVEAVETVEQRRDGEGYLYVKLAQFVPGVPSGEAPLPPVLELSDTYRTLAELQLPEAHELTVALLRTAVLAQPNEAPDRSLETRLMVEAMDRRADFDGLMNALGEHCTRHSLVTTVEALDGVGILVDGPLGDHIMNHEDLAQDSYFLAGMLTQWSIDHNQSLPSKQEFLEAFGLLRERAIALRTTSSDASSEWNGHAQSKRHEGCFAAHLE